MQKIKLDESHRARIMNINLERQEKNAFDCPYVTKEILEKMFEWFFKHKLTVQENAATWWYKNGEKQMECLGYSGYSINERDDEEGMVWNLAHEIYCKAEWFARGVKEGWYLDTCKWTFGNDCKELAKYV